jgi:hypothetical protein
VVVKKIQVDLTKVVDPQGTLHLQLTNEPVSPMCPLPPVIQGSPAAQEDRFSIIYKEAET